MEVLAGSELLISTKTSMKNKQHSTVLNRLIKPSLNG